MSAADSYVGETFEDRDSRSEGRRLRVTEVHPNQWRAEVTGTVYRAIRVDSYGKPVGKQRVKISQRTLDRRYRKVSH